MAMSWPLSSAGSAKCAAFPQQLFNRHMLPGPQASVPFSLIGRLWFYVQCTVLWLLQALSAPGVRLQGADGCMQCVSWHVDSGISGITDACTVRVVCGTLGTC